MNGTAGAPGPRPGPAVQAVDANFPDVAPSLSVFTNLTTTDNRVSDQQLFTA
jgi:hypothetical protein